MADDRERNREERFRFGRAWIDDDLGIMRLEFEPRCEIYRLEAEEQVAAMQRLAAGRPMPCLVDMRDIHKTDREARDYYAGPETAKAASACAMIIGGSAIGTVIGNFMLAIYGAKLMPLRLFANEREAITWLRGYVEVPRAASNG